MKYTTRITIPIEKSMRTALVKRAEALGFDSAQALLRYMVKAIIDGRAICFGDEIGTPLHPAHKALHIDSRG